MVAVFTVRMVVPLTAPMPAKMLVLPALAPVAKPSEPGALLMVAEPLLEAHTTCVVTFLTLPSEKVPMAVNCCLTPTGSVGLVGETAIETTTADETINKVLPVLPPKVAAMVVGPTARPLARPIEPAALLMLALLVSEELHTACVVTGCVVESVKIAIAVNCCVRPTGSDVLVGLTAIENSTAAVTVSPVVPLLPLRVAVIVVEPVETVLANPSEPAALLMVATPVFEEVQVTCVVMSCVEESVKVPVAAYCGFTPSGTEILGGVRLIETSVALVMVSLALPITAPNVAVMTAAPGSTPVASPSEPAALLMAAKLEFEELQTTWVVMSFVELSVKVPVAVYCSVSPSASDEMPGVTDMETKVAAETVSLVPPVIPDKLAVTSIGPPTPALVARPWLPAALLMVATVPSEVPQVT